jgi:NAD(P)-dependent dehydrogenase (short-subunit alcohol dehydrogenase family)
MPTAIIWGASGGIGSALVRTLKADGWRVLAAARDDARIPDAADQSVHFDAADLFSIQQAIMAFAQDAEAVDLVIYAAGGLVASPLEKQSAQDWEAVMAANLTGVFLTIQASLSLASKEAAFIVLGAYIEKITLPRMGAYVAAKAALEPLLTIFQKEHRKLKFTLARLPAVDTPFWANVPFRLPEYALKPDTVAQALLDHYANGGSGVLDL